MLRENLTVAQRLNVICGTLFLFLAAGALTASAAERVLTLDPQKTEVRFTLGATLHTVHGTLRLAEGRVQVDDQTGSVSGRVVVDARSGDTGNESRDRKMHEEVLRSASFPEIVLTLDRVEGALVSDGATDLTLVGRLRLLGAEHAVRIPARIEIAGDRVRTHFELEVPYVAWGLKDPSVFLLRVEQVVRVAVEATGALSDPDLSSGG